MGSCGRVLALLAAFTAACIVDRSVPCGELRCPVGSLCTAEGCASPEQLVACSQAEDGVTCTASGADGVCRNGVCLSVVCGDGRTLGPEACDDGNQLAGDGCSGDCRSTEVCGNNYVDGIRSEQCDSGIAGLSNDGCTSRCTAEFGSWSDVSPGIPRQGSYAAAYDERRKRFVVFVADGSSDNTWEWDGRVWRNPRPHVAPPPRSAGALAYDAKRGVVVLFGGGDVTQFFGDTWEWDGTVWTERTGPAPPARQNHALAYDRVREEIVLAGGGFADTWVWNGSTWSQRTPPSQAFNEVSSAWDAASSSVVLVTGFQTWQWNGTTWSQLADIPSARSDSGTLCEDGETVVLHGGQTFGGALDETLRLNDGAWGNFGTGPARVSHAMAYDRDRDQVVLFGGGAPEPVNDTWVMDNTGAWTVATPELFPPLHVSGGAAPESRRGTIVYFGGGVGGSDETWRWDGLSWSKQKPASSPLPRRYHAMAEDTQRDRVVLFGGISSTTAFDDTWEWDGTTWTPRAVATRPAPRFAAAAAYDSDRRVTVLFGGRDTGAFSDTWEWNGTTWTLRITASSPAPRSAAALAYDPYRRRTVLFGGRAGNTVLSDTWEWDGTNWTQVAVTSPGPARAQAPLVFDPLRHVMVLFGGLSTGNIEHNDTWELRDGAWAQTQVVVGLQATRHDHIFVHDAVNAQLVMFGGLSSPSTLSSRTVALRHGSVSSPADVCLAMDSDGDALVACNDPDCWARCTPACPPGLSCDPSSPRCGDGTCSVLEDRRLCPADCP